MIHIQRKHPLLILLIFALLLGSVVVIQAAPPRSVGLVSFEATALSNTVQLDWETATEWDTLGYIIKRSINGGAFVSLPDIGEPGFVDGDGNPAGFVLSEGGPAEGAIYQEMDNDVQIGNSYTYKLIEIDNNGSEHELAVDMVGLGQTATPTSTPTQQAAATNTAVPTAITTSTSAPVGNSNNLQPTSTNTPRPTASPTNQPTATNVPPTATATVILAPTSAPTTVPATQVAAVSETSNLASNDTNSDSGNVVFAQEEATETAVPPTPAPATNDTAEGYPPANESQAEPATDVNIETPTPITLEELPYPKATPAINSDDANSPIVSVIGSQTNNQEENNQANSSQESDSRDVQLGRVYLWGGFLLSLLIFITTVVATILLFTRKQKQ